MVFFTFGHALVSSLDDKKRVGKSGIRCRATTEELSIGSALTTGEERSSQKKILGVCGSRYRKCAAIMDKSSTLISLLTTLQLFFERKVENIRASTSKAPLPSIQSTASSLMTTFGATTSEQVARLISAAPTKHCTLDPIPTWLLKDCVAELSPFLTDLFSAAILVTAEVPPALKRAIITSLLKKPTLSAEDLASYKPVSSFHFQDSGEDSCIATC